MILDVFDILCISVGVILGNVLFLFVYEVRNSVKSRLEKIARLEEALQCLERRIGSVSGSNPVNYTEMVKTGFSYFDSMVKILGETVNQVEKRQKGKKTKNVEKKTKIEVEDDGDSEDDLSPRKIFDLNKNFSCPTKFTAL
jgi:hypothetical protein